MTGTSLAPQELYYRHSGRFAAASAALALVGGCVAAIVAALAYAYLMLYIPLAGFITFVLTGGFGFLVGFLTGRLLILGKVRNVPLAAFLAFLVGGTAFIAAWIFWVYGFLVRRGEDVALLDVVLNPAGVWRVILKINEQGAWTFKSTTPTGLLLALFWLAEAGIIMGCAVLLPVKAIKALPFCESCNRWCSKRDLTNVNTADDAELRRRLEARDFSYLQTLGQASGNPWYHIWFEGCPKCDTTQTLCVGRVTMSRDKNGKEQLQTKPVIKRLRLTPDEVVMVAQVVAALAVPSVPAMESPAVTEPSTATAEAVPHPEQSEIGRDENQNKPV